MSHIGRRGGRRGANNNSDTGGGRGGGGGRAPSSSASSSRDVTAGVERLAISTAPVEPLAVTARADELVPALSSKKAYVQPKRPGFGTIGMKCVVRANHFLVQVADRDLHHYDVTISPVVVNRAVCRKIIKQLVELYKDLNLGKLKPVYDGRKSLYTAGTLPFTSQQFNVTISEREREKEYKVNIKFAGKAELHHLQQFLLGKHFDTPQDTIQVLDIVLREFPSQNYTMVARSFFSTKPGDVKAIGDGLECWRGYYQSLRPTQMGLSLNIDISATSFYKAVPVVQFAVEYLHIVDPSRPLIERQRTALKKAIRGLRVEVTHRKDCNRLYKITGITTEPLHRLTFTADANGREVRVVDHFWEKYNCRLHRVAWPCLVSGSEKKPIHLCQWRFVRLLKARDTARN